MSTLPDEGDQPAPRPPVVAAAHATSPTTDETPRDPLAKRTRSAHILSSMDLVLVVTSSRAFESEVCALVEDAGYRAAPMPANEPSWMTFARTGARVVICDFEDPTGVVTPLAVQAIVRSIPVLVLRPRLEADDGGLETVGPGVLCAPRPGDARSLSALLYAILATAAAGTRPDPQAPMDAQVAEHWYADWLARATRAFARHAADPTSAPPDGAYRQRRRW